MLKHEFRVFLNNFRFVGCSRFREYQGCGFIRKITACGLYIQFHHGNSRASHLYVFIPAGTHDWIGF